MEAGATIARVRRSCSQGLFAAAGIIALTALAAPAAQAEFSIEELGVSASIDGVPSRQAGSHPDLQIKLRFEGTGGTVEGDPRDIHIDLPAGLVGNPTAGPRCPPFLLVKDGGGTDCSADTEVGVAVINGGTVTAVFNLARPENSLALFGLVVAGAPIFVEARLRPDDYGISMLSTRTSQAAVFDSIDITLWGAPADPSHDAARGGAGPVPSLPLITLPTFCPRAPVSFSAAVDSWQSPGVFSRALVTSDIDGEPFEFVGCDRLPFEPSVAVTPGTRRAGSPTGLDVNISVPQSEGPDGFAAAQVRDVSIALPAGMSVSLSAAAGLVGCGAAGIELGSNDAPNCPNAAKLGSVDIDTPLVEEPLHGDVILARQSDNPFDALVAFYLVVKGPGFYMKLPGEIALDPDTGQATLTLSDLPQLPFRALHLDLRGGPTAPLVNPPVCGSYAIRTEVSSWAVDHPVSFHAPMTISEDCAGKGGFDPVFQAGVTDPVAGRDSPFVLRLTRRDGDQNLSRIDATLPEGELANLAGVRVCDDAQATAGACPLASRVGTSTIVLGAGAFPLYIPQPGNTPTAVYLAGPYRSAPYSLLLQIPAHAGPFDLGTVLSRVAIRVDPTTAQARVESDPLPQILAGIPLPYRDVRVNIDRPGFMRNPTSCDRTAVSGLLTSAQGGTARRSARFQVGSCRALAFKPRFSLRLLGPTHPGAHPRSRTVLTARDGDANIDRAAVTLPGTEFLDIAHVRNVCTRARYARDRCPAGSDYGYAKIWTPLLDRPLRGPVYLRSSNHRLPDLVASLDGQIHLDLAGRIDAVDGRIRNTFRAIPDAPMSRFVLTMRGGRMGLLVNNNDLCGTTPRAGVSFGAQNGKTHASNPIVRTGCGKQK
jgi:hypothetical protein